MMRWFGALLLAGVGFAAGFWLADFYDQQRRWTDDLRPLPAPPPASLPLPPVHSERPTSPILFEESALRLGIDFTFYDGAEGQFYIFETTGGGMAAFDYDNDGRLDLYAVTGCRVPVNPVDRRYHCRLFRNRSAAGFDETTAPAGVGLVTYGQGTAAADYDNDGFQDLLVTGVGRLVLYRNNGDGTFSDVSRDTGVTSSAWSTSAAFADLDQDGALDLYVCTYAEVSIEHPIVCDRNGVRMHCLPRRYPAQPDLLFHNRGDGTFRESAPAAGIKDRNGRGLAVAVADLDNDGRPDIFVANDTSENYLFQNRGGFRFRDIALDLGVAVTGEGSTMSGMGIACGDIDHNGFLDLMVTNFYGDSSVLYQNLGKGGFVDAAQTSGIGVGSRDRLGFGAIFLDADRDGRLDLFVANGHISNLSSEGVPYKMRQQLFANLGGGKFRDVSDAAGPYFQEYFLGRGVAAGDFNNDGRPDLVVSHILDPLALLLNKSTGGNHWLGLELVGRTSNRDATNTRVTVTIAGQERLYETLGGTGYLSSSDKRLIIGLGQEKQPGTISITWPSGRRQQLPTAVIDRYLLLVEPPST